MTCDCERGTVWFDHKVGVWRHAPADPEPCKKPMPYNVCKHSEKR